MVTWVSPAKCWPPHKVTHPEKVKELLEQFKLDKGWGVGFEALVGYHTIDQNETLKVQLLSGSHRWAAAILAGIRVPVVIVSERTVEDAWGNVQMWKTIMGMGTNHARRFM